MRRESDPNIQMPIALTHIAEKVFAKMVNKHRDAFLSFCGLKDKADADFVKAVPELAACEVRFEKFGGRAFDGASRIDVVVRLGPDRAVPFELKLGSTRLNKARINGEWLAPCQPSHDGLRWKGNMMAILDRRFSGDVPDELAVKVEGERITLTRNWFVITRRQTLKAWKTSRPDFGEHVDFRAFDDVVDRCGGQNEFNPMIREMLDFDFYSKWFDEELKHR